MLTAAIALSGYTVTELLHQTANTAVYRGYRDSDGIPVVIKLLQAEYPILKDIERFKHEYEIACDLKIPGVVKPYALVNHNNSLALILEDFGGQSLKKVLETEKTIEIINFIFIAIRLAETLGDLHTKNIIHKDIKPHNIIFNPKTCQVKITDFSIASRLPKETSTISSPNTLEGTLAYMSPEQTGRMNRAIDYRTDLYSLGATFYEMLTGQLPFPTTDPLELVHCHIAKTPVVPDELNPAVPPVVSDLVMKLLAKTAEDRYQSAYGLKADLEECLMQLQLTGKIEKFPLGRQDKSGLFQIPEKLYGREVDVANLLAAFERVSSGTTEMMLVGGYSGIGKSSLVNEVYNQIVRQRGYFISGKFDQFNRNIPYASLIQAFQELMQQLLTESQSRIEVWKLKLLNAFGSNGQVIIDVIPEVELIVGKQPPVPQLGSAESQNRFNFVFKQFIHVFTDVEHPLVLFLDDLQWADSASLKLIQLLMTDPHSQYLLILGSFRDNEVSPTHPLMLMLDQIRLKGAKVHTFTLENLDLENISKLIADTLNESREKITPIAELVFHKTQGNPLFLTQLLQFLYQDKLLIFNFRSGRWQWDIELLQESGITDNVVDLMVSKIQKFSESTQQVLQLAACVGNRFDLTTLALVNEQSPKATEAQLWSAVQTGLILPLSNDYKIPILEFDDLMLEYKFFHDRVQQAAYALIPNDQKKAVHRKVGQLLLKNTQPQELEENIFDIVNHLNIGLELLAYQSEKDELANLNLIAGHKAKSSTAHEAALKYLTVGIKLLADDSWQSEYKLTLSLYLERIECEYLVGNFEAAEFLVELALKQAKSNQDKAAINNIRIVHYQNSARYEHAIKIGLETLKLFGMDLPYSPDEATLSTAALEVQKNLGNRAIADLIDAPEIVDPEPITIIRLLMNLVPPTYLINQPLLILGVLKMTALSLKYGNTALSVFVYAWYGTILCGNYNEYETGYEFGSLALKLNEKYKDTSLTGKLYMSFGNFISHWRKLVKNNISLQKIAYEAAMEAGDFSWCHHSALFAFWQRFVICKDVTSIPLEYEKHISFAKETELTAALALMLQRNIFLNLQGLTKSQDSLSNESFDEAVALETFKDKSYDYGTNTYHFSKLFIFYLYENYVAAYEMAIAADKTLAAINSQFQVTLHYFYKSLTLLALYPTANYEEKQQYWEILQADRESLKIWSENCPENFLANYLLVEAEVARVTEQNWQASELYERAIAAARENEFIYTEALANELAAKFYLTIGREKIAKVYMRDARYSYLKWGATAKVEDLDAKYEQLLERVVQDRGTSTETTWKTTTTISTSTAGSNSQTLDWMTVVKASLTLSSEIVLESLLKKLLKIMLENAGAKTGCFIAKKQEQWVIEAEGAIEKEEVTALQYTPIESNNVLPVSIINYVDRTRTNLVLDDAVRSEIFKNDPYIIQKKPKSILCSPIVHQGKLTGILYLENNVTTGAFTSDRLEVIQVLTSQISISLDNAHLYTNLQRYSQELELKNEALQDSEAREREKAVILEQSLHKLQQTQAQLVQTEKISSLGQLVAGVAHEVNNPVSFIAGNLHHASEYTCDLLNHLQLYQKYLPNPPEEILEDAETIDLEYLIEDLPKMLSSMKVGTERIRDIMQSLRNFSRVDEQGKKPTDIHAGLDSTLMILQHRLKAKAERPAIQVVKEYGNLPLVECYAGQVNQVFMNLLANAIDAVEEFYAGKKAEGLNLPANLQPATPCIRIRTHLSDSNHVTIGIADNSLGMTEEVRSRLFQPFFTTKPVGKGTGLGLSISYQIVVEKHRGELKCISAPGEGTEFVIQIPV